MQNYNYKSKTMILKKTYTRKINKSLFENIKKWQIENLNLRNIVPSFLIPRFRFCPIAKMKTRFLKNLNKFDSGKKL